MEKFAERLKFLRKQKGLTQVQVAELINVKERHYQNIEYGKVNIPTMDLIKLADYFDVSLDWLTGRTDNPDSHTITLEWQQDIDKVMGTLMITAAANPEFEKVLKRILNRK